MNPRCRASAQALRELADLVESGVVTLTTVNVTYGREMTADHLPLETSVDLKLHHTGANVPDPAERKAVITNTGHLLNCVTLSNVEVA